MNERRGDPSSGRPKSKPKRAPIRSRSGTWSPYAIAGGVVVLVTDSVPSSSGSTASLADFRGSKVVVYFYEGGG